MKRKILAGLLAAALAVTTLAGCGSSSTDKSASEKKEDTASTEEKTDDSSSAETESKYKKSSDYDASGDAKQELVFTSVSVTGDSHTTAMQTFADAVADLSGGSVTCKTYADGTLFAADAEWNALTTDQADLAYISFPTLATQPGLEWCGMIGSAYFWNSYDHMTGVLNGDLGKNTIFPKIEEKVNAVPLSAFYLGVRVINTRNKEIHQWSDMNGLLLRMPNSETWLALGEALGANPTPVAFSELYTSLSTGAVDGQDNPLPTDVSAKFYEVAKYISLTNHVVDSIIPMINKDKWNALTDAQKSAVQDAMEYARQDNDKLRQEEEAKDVQTLKDNGCTVVEDPDIDDFKSHAQEYYKNHPDLTKDWDMDLYQQIQDADK